MEYTIRPLKENDYDEILLKWWEDWGWVAPTRDFLPQNGAGGFIVYDNDIPICAGFLYVTNSQVSWVDWIISNKDFRGHLQRKEALKLLITKLSSMSEKLGNKYIYALLKHQSLIKVYEEVGYIQGDSYTKEMIKILK